MIKKIISSFLLLFLTTQIFAVNPDDLLSPDEAFIPSLTKLSDDRIKATWDIADTYFMYRKRFKFESDTAGITFGEPIIPKGKVKDDPFFGKVETYRKQISIELPVIRDASASGALQLSVKTVSQGCADAGICYPPQKKTLTIELEAVKAVAASKIATPAIAGEDLKEGSINMMAELGLSNLVNTNPPIPPEEAFQVKLSASDGQLLKANWAITKGHYLYQNKLKLRLIDPGKGLTIGALDLPPSIKEIDPFFGEMNTYNEDFLVTAKIDGDPNLLTKEFMVKATYQGCSKLTGICYPPQHDTLKVNFNSGQLIKVAATSEAATSQQIINESTLSKIESNSSPLSLLPAAASSSSFNSNSSETMPMMDTIPDSAKQPSIMAEFSGSNGIVSSSPVSSSPAPASNSVIGTSSLASQFGVPSLGDGSDPVDPEVAYVFDITASDKKTLNARWDILKGHYLYQHKFKFEVIGDNIAGNNAGNSGITLGEAILPEGKEEFDQYFGDVITYNESFDAKVPMIYNSADNIEAVTVKTSYQGCSKLTGICYPPQYKIQTVNLAKAQAVATAIKVSTNSSTPKAITENPDASVQAVAPKNADNLGAVNTAENKENSKSAENALSDSKNAASNTANAAANNKVSEQDGLINKLTNGGFFQALFIFFIAGLALTFTPCVFPMIPILSGIIAGQGSDNSTKKSFFLSLSYVLAMAVTYAIVGVIAALSGENLQVALQNPWVIGSFAVLFVLLSLSMFGFYELQMPASIQTKLTNISNSQNGGSMANAGVMGFLSALIVGPCVTAPLIAALVYIANTKDVVLGGLSLFSLGLGMGVPLLIIGTSAGKVLPKAGAWMDSVKAGFGIMMLAMGIWMLERILPFEIIVVLAGILIVFTGIYMGALDSLTESSTGWKRFFKAAGLIVLIYGASLLIGAASGNASLIKPLKGFAGGGGTSQVNAEPEHLVFKKIKDINDLDNALAMAKQNGQSVMLDFYADWCISCKEMEHTTFKNKAVIESLKDTLLIQADVTLDDEKDKALNKHFGLYGPPAIIFFDKEGKENKPYRIVGYKGSKDFNDHVQQFKQTLN